MRIVLKLNTLIPIPIANMNIDPDPDKAYQSDESSEIDRSGAKEVDEGSILPRCSHYNRGCYLVFGCCNKSFSCKFCHDEMMTDLKLDKSLVHEYDKEKISNMKCRYCLTEQDIGETCVNCSKQMGKYICKECRLLDLDEKGQFHCDECGICRRGGRDNYKHCNKCGICTLHNHICGIKVDGNCPICQERLFDSQRSTISAKCGHWMHTVCFNDYVDTNYRCPICMKSMVDMTIHDRFMDEQIANTPMPDEYKDMIVDILCNECCERSKVHHHFYGHRCPKCMCYNTRQT